MSILLYYLQGRGTRTLVTLTTINLKSPPVTLCCNPGSTNRFLNIMKAKSNDSRELQEECRAKITQLTEGSHLFKVGDLSISTSRGQIVKIVNDEVSVGPVLGSGAFSDVKVFNSDFLNDTSSSNVSENDATGSCDDIDDGLDSLGKPCLQTEKSYALKILRDDLTNSMHRMGAMHLTVETEFLSNLSHPNIVTIFGKGGCSPGDTNYFIVLERLRSTLFEEICTWREEVKEAKLAKASRKDRNSEIENILNQRIDIARQISAGLMYLHEHRVLFRDIKPENIGINCDNCVKLFDFGMAKELKKSLYKGPNQFDATGRTGTPRYMAPEVFFSEPYGLPSDVFSYVLVLWEIMALETIFVDEASSEKQQSHLLNVYVKKRRPKISRNWPKQVQACIKHGWNHDPSDRPKMKEINSLLNNYMKSI